MELLKVKLQMQMHNDPNLRQYSGPVDCARKIVRTQGVLGLWTALPASLVYRSNFFWLFGSFEVSFSTTPFFLARVTLTIRFRERHRP